MGAKTRRLDTPGVRYAKNVRSKNARDAADSSRRIKPPASFARTAALNTIIATGHPLLTRLLFRVRLGTS